MRKSFLGQASVRPNSKDLENLSSAESDLLSNDLLAENAK
jgi:hypothetical protein